MSKVGVPLRILCIHGYRQSSASFREKTGALRKLLKKQVELVYIDAPHTVPTSKGKCSNTCLFMQLSNQADMCRQPGPPQALLVP